MPRRALCGISIKNLVRSDWSICRQCYQESPAIAHPALRRSAARMPGNISSDECGVENVGANVNCLSMNDVSPEHNAYDVAVIGGGPAGLAAAIALAETGANTALIARRAPYGDNRTTALLGGSVDFLRQLDVWRRCEDKAAALRGDAAGRRHRPPDPRAGSQVFVAKRSASMHSDTMSKTAC